MDLVLLEVPRCLNLKPLYDHLRRSKRGTRLSDKVLLNKIPRLLAKNKYAAREHYTVLLLGYYNDLNAAISDLLLRKRVNLHNVNKFLIDTDLKDKESCYNVTYLNDTEVAYVFKKLSSYRSDIKEYIEIINAVATVVNL